MGEDLRAIDFANKGKNNWIIVNGDLVLSGKTAAQSSSSSRMLHRAHLLRTVRIRRMDLLRVCCSEAIFW